MSGLHLVTAKATAHPAVPPPIMSTVILSCKSAELNCAQGRQHFIPSYRNGAIGLWTLEVGENSGEDTQSALLPAASQGDQNIASSIKLSGELSARSMAHVTNATDVPFSAFLDDLRPV